MTPEEILALTSVEREQMPVFDCTDCTRCAGCWDCTRCTGCTRCADCTDCTRCTGCTRCNDCADCTGIKNGRGLRYVAFGVQLTAQQWQQWEPET